MKYNYLTTTVMSFVFSLQAHTAEFCVNDKDGLQLALSIADSNNQDNVIKITAGVYETNGEPFLYQSNGGFDLEMSGGWSQFEGNPCGRQDQSDPFGTTLDGLSENRVMDIQLSGNSNLTISNLVFVNGFDDMADGGGLYVFQSNKLSTGTVTIENNVFLNNVARFAAAMKLDEAETIVVRNNLFISNAADVLNTIEIVQNDGIGIYFTNNTVMFNGGIEINSRGGVLIAAFGTSKALVANNIITENSNEDLFISGSQVYLKHNNVGVVGGSSPLESAGNVNLPTRFEPGILNFTPSSISPSVNAGTEPCSGLCQIPPPFDESWEIGDLDLAGGPRLQKNVVDIGAYESSLNAELIFWNRFE